MNKLIRAAILAFALIAGFSPAFAQAPPPVPALPDAERRTSYVIAATTCICNVNFALYGDSTDYASWVEVYLNGVRVNFNDGTFGWTITSPTGALGSIPRPVTDAVLTFNGAQTGTVQIVGARRPRRTSTFAENRGVAARDLNQILNDMIAQNRETWDKTNDVTGRALISQPGNTIGLLPLPSACAGKFLGFDPTGLIPQCSAGGAGSGNVVGPVSSTIGHLALWNNATGTLLQDFNGTSGGIPWFMSTGAIASSALLTLNGVVIGGGAGATPATVAVGTNNQAFMGNTGAAPGFRALVAADIPSPINPVTPNIQTTNYSIQTSDCGKTVQLGTGSTGFATFTLPAPAGFTAGCIVTIKNGDTTRGKGLSGFPTGFSQGQNVLWPLQSGSVQIVNSVWATVQRPGRAKLAGGTFNVNSDFTNGTDTAGATDGMASGASAFKTLQKAMYNACDEFDLTSSPQAIYNINMAANTTDTSGAHYACPHVPGAQGGASITVTGGTNATLSTTNLDAIAVDVNATISLVGVTLQSTGTISGSTRPADCVRADFGGQIFAIGNITVQCAGSSYAAENGGKIYVVSNDNDNGNSATHFFASTGGVISTDYPTGTLTTTIGANITKSVAWAKAVQGGVINVPTWAFSLGAFTVTGTREITGSGGQINTGGTPLACQTTYFPGTVNGTSVCAPDFTATTWTPTITTDATPGTPTYNLRVGSYEQIGRQVTVRFTVSLSAWPGAPTGNVLISGLPIATANVANDNATCFVGSYGVTGLAANNFGIGGIILPNTSTILLTQNGTAQTASVTAAQAGATLQFIGTCFYHT